MTCTISQLYVGKELYMFWTDLLSIIRMFWTDLLSIIRSLNTVYTAMGIGHASYVGCLLADTQHNS